MTSVPLSPADAKTVASDWIRDFGAALESRDETVLEGLLAEGGWWRDLLAFSWTLRNFSGQPEVLKGLSTSLDATNPRNFELSLTTEPASLVVGDNVEVSVIFGFETRAGVARGFARLVSADGNRPWKALALVTALEQLHGFPEHTGSNRPEGGHFGEVLGRQGWAQAREETAEFRNSEPAVVVIGAGQNGVCISARLGQLDVPTLLIERNDRVGDNWRKRYPSLVLHDPVGLDQLPYMRYPPTWPASQPGAKFGDWLEFFSQALELNVWTGSEVVSASFEEREGRWTLQVRRADGSVRTVRPQHLVLSTGLNGEPDIPDVPGFDKFKGTVMHSGVFPGGAAFKGKRAIVVGAGTSGHDVAHDLYENGADVTLVQRSSSYIISSKTHYELFLPIYLEGGPNTEDADLMGASLSPGVAMTTLGPMVELAAERDKELLDDLCKVGYSLADDGIFARHLSGRDGYYIEIGAARLIAEGKIKLKQGSGAKELTADGVTFFDGETLPADLVVFATGFTGVLKEAQSLVGSAVDNIPQIYGVAPDGELAANYRYSGHDNLWFSVGTVPLARFYSKFLAQQIKALAEGIITNDDLRRATAESVERGYAAAAD